MRVVLREDARAFADAHRNILYESSCEIGNDLDMADTYIAGIILFTNLLSEIYHILLRKNDSKMTYHLAANRLNHI